MISYNKYFSFQIGKDSLKRTHQLCGIKGTPRVTKRDSFSNSAINDYPTLKKSSPANVQIGKETPKLNVSECVDIVKPERSKKISTKSSSPIQKSPTYELDDSSETANKYKKFGIRVLPDSKEPLKTTSPTHDGDFNYKSKLNEKQGTIPDLIDSNKIEKEHHQNENNAIIEKTVTTSKSAVIKDKQSNNGNSQNYGNNQTSCSNFYAERGIDVGEEQEIFRPREYEVKRRNQEINNTVSVQKEIKFGKESNDDSCFSSGQVNSQGKINELKLKQKGVSGKLIKQSNQSDSNNIGEENETNTNFNTNKNYLVAREKDIDGQIEHKNVIDKNTIPTEIPEEVCKAAMAAQSNRRSVNNTNIPLSKINKVSLNTEDLPKNLSEDSSSDASSGILSDEYGKHLKKSNKRKAPPPPPDDIDNKQKVSDEYEDSTTEHLEIDNHNFLKCKNSTNTLANDDMHFKKDNIDPLGSNAISYDCNKLYMTTDSENPKTILSFGNFAEQLDVHEENQDIAQILIQDDNSKNINQASCQGNDKHDKLETNHLMQTLVVHENNNSKLDTIDCDGSQLTSKFMTNASCDSDSDLETFDADFVLEGVKNKVGGTTIELNSSQITVHHSPSSTSVSVDLESDNNRKAASLGDLSRLDTDQPMSILERAVSLDLADGVSPIGSKKRKAPQPPAGDDCIGSLQDYDDGNVYKKEPRLDVAVDTYGRRLKKSSDWGTMEEALKQTENIEAQCKMEQLEHSLKAVTSNVDCLNNITSATLQAKDLDDSVFVSEVQNMNNSSDMDKIKRDPEDIKTDEKVNNSLISQKGMFKLSSDYETYPEGINNSKVDSGCNTGLIASEPSNIQVSDIFPTTRPILLAVSRKMADGDGLDSPSNATFGIVNSTPLSTTNVSSNKDFVNISPIMHNKEKLSEGTWQTPTLSYNSKISNYTFKDPSADKVNLTFLDNDTNNEIASSTDPFITATSNIYVHKTAQNTPIDDDIIWNLDTKPPDLPTSPIPVLPQSTGSFNPSSSMTYVTEIQVVTSDNDRHPEKLPSIMNLESDLGILNSEFKPNVVIQNINKNDFSVTPKVDDDIKTVENKRSNTMVHGSKNVTVTSITPPPLTPDLKITDLSSVGSFVTTADNAHNKKNNYERPPVPPRKYDMGMSVSSVVKDVYKNYQVPENVSPTLQNKTPNSPTENVSGNFVSFSTLTPRTSKYGDKNFQNNSSFEQWVFLEESCEPSITKPNNLDTTFVQTGDTSRPLNATLSTFASPSSSKAQSITHIILDTEKNSGQALNK